MDVFLYYCLEECKAESCVCRGVVILDDEANRFETISDASDSANIQSVLMASL